MRLLNKLQTLRSSWSWSLLWDRIAHLSKQTYLRRSISATTTGQYFFCWRGYQPLVEKQQMRRIELDSFDKKFSLKNVDEVEGEEARVQKALTANVAWIHLIHRFFWLLHQKKRLGDFSQLSTFAQFCSPWLNIAKLCSTFAQLRVTQLQLVIASPLAEINRLL